MTISLIESGVAIDNKATGPVSLLRIISRKCTKSDVVLTGASSVFNNQALFACPTLPASSINSLTVSLTMLTFCKCNTNVENNVP